MSQKDGHPEWESFKSFWPNADKSRFVDAGSLRWHVQEMGHENKTQILLLHGTGASTHSFGDLMPILAQDHHVLAVDLPGHGFTSQTSSRGLSLPGMSRSISTLLRVLQFDPALVLGHSAGVAIAIWMTLEKHIAPKAIIGLNAALQPIQGNALFSPMAKLLFVNPLTTRMVSFQAKYLDLAPKLLKATATELSPEKVTLYHELIQRRSHIDGALGMMANWDLEPLQERLSSLDIPLYLIAAKDDAMVPASVSKHAAAKAKNAHYINIDKGGHLLHEAEPKKVAEMVRDFATALN